MKRRGWSFDEEGRGVVDGEGSDRRGWSFFDEEGARDFWVRGSGKGLIFHK